jgi:tRNA(Ile)-lysidine synthase
MREGRRAMVGSLLIDAAGERDGSIWRISSAPRRKS